MEEEDQFVTFQSYYSLISNNGIGSKTADKIIFQSYYSLISNNTYSYKVIYKRKFQSYYSLISNILIALFKANVYNISILL